MSVGNTVKKIVTEFNVRLRMYKFMGGFKPNQTGSVLGNSTFKDDPHLKHHLNPVPVCMNNNEITKFHFISPKLDVIIQKSIIEPQKMIKIHFELPIRNSTINELHLPLHNEKEIKEPGKVISKKAVKMIRVRRRKMRKHKRKKYQKKFATLLAKLKLRRAMEHEAKLQASLRDILEEKDKFSAEKYVDDLLGKVNWVRPVTKVKGRLAPQWVIKQHLQETEEKRNINERIKEYSE